MKLALRGGQKRGKKEIKFAQSLARVRVGGGKIGGKFDSGSQTLKKVGVLYRDVSLGEKSGKRPPKRTSRVTGSPTQEKKVLTKAARLLKGGL